MQAGNLYVFVKNNPVMFIDPWGLAAGWAGTWCSVQERNVITATSPGGSQGPSIWASSGGSSGGSSSTLGSHSIHTVTHPSGLVTTSFHCRVTGNWVGGFDSSGWSATPSGVGSNIRTPISNLIDFGARYVSGNGWTHPDLIHNTEMIFLGGHGAFNGRFRAYHMHIAMFVSSGSSWWYHEAFVNNTTRWGFRYAYISGTMGGFFRTEGAINAADYMGRANRQFWNHLYSGNGMVQQLFDGFHYFDDNHRRTFAYSGRWTNSTSFTIGLVNAVGLNHGLSSEQVARAWGINNAFDARYFGR